MSDNTDALAKLTQDIETRLETLEQSNAELGKIADLLEANLLQLDEESSETKETLTLIAPMLRYLLERSKVHDEVLKTHFEIDRMLLQGLLQMGILLTEEAGVEEG
ncbi:MAG: hypothetical protein OXR67_09130 [Chloroflexota bacterium]|nr:hypothetical protein [Chloroflexota bacterium]